MSNFLKEVTQSNIYLQPIQFILGIGLNTMTILVLNCRALRVSPCTHYFASAVFSILYMVQVCPTAFLRAYNIDWTANPIGCKINNFSIYVPAIITQAMLFLASFDRFCSSSKSLRLRSKSTIRNAKRMILIATIVIAITMLPALIIYYWNQDFKICQLHSGLVVLIYAYTQLLFTSTLIPLMTIVFGCLTMFNIRQSTARVGNRGIVQKHRRTEGQLTRMLILQIIVLVTFKIPFLVVFGIHIFYPTTQTAYMWAIRNITVIIAQSEYYITFFLYILSGQIYRDQLVKLFKKIGCINRIYNSLRVTRQNRT